MAFTDEQLKGWGLTAVEGGSEDEGVINDGKGNYYQINNFQRGKSEGLDEDKGAPLVLLFMKMQKLKAMASLASILLMTYKVLYAR